jgi:hypothetical protein
MPTIISAGSNTARSYGYLSVGGLSFNFTPMALMGGTSTYFNSLGGTTGAFPFSNTLVANGNRFVTAGISSSSYNILNTANSTNGVTWTSLSNLPVSGSSSYLSIPFIATNPNNNTTANYIITGLINQYGYGSYYYSSDDVTWVGPNNYPTGQTTILTNVIYGTQWVAVAYNYASNYVYTSYSTSGGTSWSSWTLLSGSPPILYFNAIGGLIYTSGLGYYMFATAQSGESVFSTSTNGVSWSAISYPTTYINPPSTFPIVGVASSGRGSTDTVMLISNSQWCFMNASGVFSTLGSLPTGTWTSVMYSNSNKCWLIFGYDSNQYPIYSYSTNNGTTWSAAASVGGTTTAYTITGAAENSSGVIGIVGYTNTGNYGSFSHS